MFEWLFKYPRADFLTGRPGLAHPIRIELAIAGLIAIAFVVGWMYRREREIRSRILRITLATLRSAGLILLAVLLLEPILKVRHAQTDKNVVAIALDVSQSMSLKFGDGATSRFDRARSVLSAAHGPLEKLAAVADVRLYAFGSTARSLDPAALSSQTPADGRTNLVGAVRDILQTSRGQTLPALILLTDGIDTSRADVAGIARYAAAHGTALHTVGFGSSASAPDLEVAAIHCPDKAQVGSLVPLRVVVNRQAVRTPFNVQLFRGTVFIKDLTVPASEEDGPVALRMSFVAEQKGPGDYRIVIPPVKGEQITDNNARDFHIQVDEDRAEVLFVEGSPRHEFAFVRRVMSDSRFFKLVTLLRLGHKRYYSSSEDDSSMLTGGFPISAEELGRFKAIVLSDVEAAEFTPAQLVMIGDFVKAGGGLLMLGGVNSFNLGGYAGTSLADLLPISLDSQSVSPTFDQREFAFVPTAEGADHEVLRLASDSADNLSQWKLMPTLKGSNPLYTAKAGAHVLAYAQPVGAESNGGHPAVALAVQDVGAGRIAAFAAAGSWRWKMLRPIDDDTFQRFWSQMIRWLAAGSKELMSLSTDDTLATVRQPVSIDVNVLDKAHHPCNTAKVLATIKDPLGNTETIPIPWSIQQEGIYNVSYVPSVRGQYTISAEAQVPGGKLSASPVTFVAIENSVEFAHPMMNAAGLQQLAEVSGGTSDLNGNMDRAVSSIIDQLKQQAGHPDLVEDRELRDAPVLLIALLVLWFTEWMLRRKSGLA